MKRALLSQIKNDWKENLWLVIELLIVSLIIWWLSLTLLRWYKDYHVPLGADTTDVYAAEVDFFSAQRNVFNQYEGISEDSLRMLTSEMQAILDRVRDLPMVEAAAFGSNCLPYNYNNIGNYLGYASGKDTIRIYSNQRLMTPEGAKVLRLQSLTGTSLDRLQEILESGQPLVGDSYLMYKAERENKFQFSDMIGKELLHYNAGLKIGDAIRTVRRNHYEVNYGSSSFIVPVQENTPQLTDLSTLMVRVKPGTGEEFKKAMEKEPALVSPNNVSLSNLRSMEVDKRQATWSKEVQTRTYIAGILFLLVIIFIGLLGTFWYRVHLRTPEIAVRKTFGATNTDIFRRFVSEGLLLLFIALALGCGLCILFIDNLKTGILEFVCAYYTWKWDMAISGIFTAAIMALMILIGVGIPARRAMKIEPAIALKEE